MSGILHKKRFPTSGNDTVWGLTYELLSNNVSIGNVAEVNNKIRVESNNSERLDKGKLDFRWEMLQRIEATIEGISSAIEKGMAQRSKGEKEVEERKAVLIENEKKMNGVKEKLIQLQRQVSISSTSC